MLNRRISPRLQMRQASDIPRNNHVRLSSLQIIQLVVAQTIRQLRLQHRISPCRTTAKMTIGAQLHINTGTAKNLLHLPTNLLSMLQSARRMISHTLPDLALELARQLHFKVRQNLADVTCELRNPMRLGGISSVLL